jgi:hypothetical protein
MVDDYIGEAYSHLNLQRQPNENQRHPSADLVVLDLYWRRFFQNSISYVSCTEIEQVVRFTQYRKKFMYDLEQLKALGKTEKGRRVTAAVRTSILLGICECVNWVDMLVRRVVLQELMQELAVDTDNFKEHERQKFIDDPGEQLTDISVEHLL